MTTLKQKVKNYIMSIDEDELMELHNDYCDAHNNPVALIYENNDLFLNERFSNPSDLARVITKDYRYNHDFVKFDGYGNLESSDYVWSLINDYSELVDYVINENQSYLDLWGIEPEEEEE